MRHMLAVIAMFVIAAVVAAYILDHQRLRFPWEDVIRIEAQFANAQAVTPGQGQTVTVAGVKVGDIGEVRLEDGRALVELELDPHKLGPIYRNATMMLRPKTGLNDMSIQLDPGSPDPRLPERGRLHDGDRIAASGTVPNVNPDEVFAALDGDARRYLSIVANAGGGGLEGRGMDLRAVLKAGQPTIRRLARVNGAIVDRRAKLRRLVANLRRLARATASKDRELASLVGAASASFSTIGEREAELRGAVERLPGALGATRRALRATRVLADEVGPAAEELRPSARALGPALTELRPLLRDATPIVREDLRPLVREAIPLVRRLRPSLRDLNRATPDLVRTGKVLNYVVNELGYNPPGPEEGYLFWLAWFDHNANSILSIDDAHGVAWRGLVMVGCSTLGEALDANPALAPLGAVPICPGTP
jgi:phospholipid/cholesterol/gamma-HCH transport system substrate-binding protein